MQVDGRRKIIRNEAGVIEKFGVPPALIPDYLALVGDSADGYPGIAGIGAKGAARLLQKYGPIEGFPAEELGDQREPALLFKRLATLRTDASLFPDVAALRWEGPGPAWPEWVDRIGDPRLAGRCAALATG